MMWNCDYFLWLANQAGINELFAVPAAIIIVLTIIVWLFNRRKWPFRWTYGLLLLTPTVITFLILICGTVFERNSPLHSEITQLILLGLLILEGMIILWTVWLMKGYRTVALLAGVFQFLFSLLAAFISAMSISGTWL